MKAFGKPCIEMDKCHIKELVVVFPYAYIFQKRSQVLLSIQRFSVITFILYVLSLPLRKTNSDLFSLNINFNIVK